MSKKIWMIICIICLLGAAGIGCSLIKDSAQKEEQQDAYEELAQEMTAAENATEEDGAAANSKAETAVPDEDRTSETEPESVGITEEAETEITELSPLEQKYIDLEETYGIEIPRKEIDFEKLWAETNDDIYAWIHVPGTQVDYPVLQHLNDDLYYLYYNIDGSKGYPGCIYTETRNNKDFSDRQTVIYGHNMKNGSMFGELHNYEDSKFFEEHPYIYIYTPDDIFVYQIFRAYNYSDTHLLLGFDTKSETGFNEYLDVIRSHKTLTSNANEELLAGLSAEDKIVTLSTCVANQDYQRYLVQGVLLNEN